MRYIYFRNCTFETSPQILHIILYFTFPKKHLLVQLYTAITAGMVIYNSFLSILMEFGSKVLLMRFSGIHSCKLVNVVNEAEFLDDVQKKVLGVFLFAIHSHLYSIALRLFLQTHATSYCFWSSVFGHCQEERRTT